MPAASPTLLIVLGPLGQSATAALLLAHAGPAWLLPAAEAWAVGVSVAALVWLAVAMTVVVRVRPAFTMTWWSFTFPVGTVVTGLAGLTALASGPIGAGLAALTLLLWAGLVAAWLLVSARTVHGALRGGLLR